MLVEANALADEDGNIAPEDRKRVVICPVSNLESILSRATEESLLASLKASNEDKYQGWMLTEVHRDIGAAKEFGNPKLYPFELKSVLPWWDRFGESDDEQNAA